MAINLSSYLVTDDLTILLGLISATVFLLHTFYRPQPLVHPILLGRQSDVARVRNPGESAVYRNYGTGLMGRFSLRPNKDVHILADLIRPEQDAPRTLWNTKITNAALQDRIAAFGTGLLRLAGLQNSADASVLLLLNDCIEFLIADLALASHSIPSLTISNSTLLSAVLESRPPTALITNADLLPNLLELIYDSHDGDNTKGWVIVVVGELSSRAMASVASNVKVLNWTEVEREGVRVEKILSPTLPRPNDVFTVSFFANENGVLQATQLTHENLTAGVSATRALLPMAHSVTSLDTIVSSHSMATAYGRAIAYTALYEGTSFATLASSKVFRADESAPKHDVADFLTVMKYPIPSPTILFLHPGHLEALVNSILERAKNSSLLNSFAWRHKVAGIQEGFITKDSLWDRLVYDGARASVIGEGAGTVRAVIVGGGPLPASILTPARVALSVPFVNMFTHPTVAGPVFASHPLDLQDFSVPGSNQTAPVGPPSINIEAKVVGVSDPGLESGEQDPTGVLLIRGPPVGKFLIVSGSVAESGYVNVEREGNNGNGSEKDENDGWIGTGVRASVSTNGAFRILGA